jgi:hypothetical protein
MAVLKWHRAYCRMAKGVPTMSKLRKFVPVCLAAAGLSVFSASVLANNKVDPGLVEHSPGKVVGRMEKRQVELHDKLALQQGIAAKARADKSLSEHDWAPLLALHVEAEGLSIR